MNAEAMQRQLQGTLRCALQDKEDFCDHVQRSPTPAAEGGLLDLFRCTAAVEICTRALQQLEAGSSPQAQLRGWLKQILWLGAHPGSNSNQGSNLLERARLQVYCELYNQCSVEEL